MMASCVLIAASTIVAAAGALGQQQHILPAHLEHSRHVLGGLPQPATVEECKRVHAHATRTARRIEAHHGHKRPALSSASPAGALVSSAPGQMLRPVDFGADPTGAKDSTAAMQADMAALLSRRDPSVSMASNITDQEG